MCKVAMSLAPVRLSARKQSTPRISSCGLPVPTPRAAFELEERTGRKRTAAAILAAKANALPQPAATKRARRAAGSYIELAGAGMTLDGERAKRATKAPGQAKAPRRRYTVARKKSAAPPPAAATAMDTDEDYAEAHGAAWALVSLSGSPSNSASAAAQAAEYTSDAHKSPTTSGDESVRALAGDSSDEDGCIPIDTAAKLLLEFYAVSALHAAPEDI